ncbi:protein polybromo-1-like isoform X4 [Ptychodera flava]
MSEGGVTWYKMPRPQGVTPPEEKWKLVHLFQRIQSYKDENGRQLSESLQKSPTQKENPEYHKLVNRPIDFSGIIIKMQKEQYNSVEEMIEDLLLLFNNTVKVFKPYTQIYKDALTLHCVLLQAQTELIDLDHNRVEVPDVQQCVQEILKTIYTNILNFQDESGKYLLTALVNFLERECSEEMLLIDFSTVSNKLYTGCYQRLDQMQKDLFSIFEKIRHLAKDNQEIYYASVRLQEYYILSREQVCEWGQVLDSPALRYINGHLQSDLKMEKAMEKAVRAGGSPDSTSDIDVDYSNMTVPLINMRTNERCVREDGSPSFEQYVTETGCYKIGDCVYLHPDGRNKPGIAKIDVLWEDKEGIPWFQGPVFLYAEDTKHLPTTVFYEKEVFQGHSIIRQMSDVIGKCAVLHISDYIRGRCTEIPEDDVCVYRCRYEEGREFWKCGVKTGQRQGSKQVPSDEWYFFKKPLQLWTNQGSPFLQEALSECLNATEPSPQATESEPKAVAAEGKTKLPESKVPESTETEEKRTDVEQPQEMQPAQAEEQTYDADADEVLDFEHNRRIKFTNGYPLFLREKYSSFKRKFPGKTINEIRRMIHLKWKKLDSEEQMQYHLKAREKIKKNFHKPAPRRSVGRPVKNDQRTRSQVVTPSILNIRVPKVKPNNDQRGKHCRRGFNMLVADMHGQLKEQYPDSSKKDLMKIINEKWQSLTKEEQETFHVRARESMLKRQMKKYGRQLAYMDVKEGEEKRRQMIQIGTKRLEPMQEQSPQLKRTKTPAK